MQATAEAQPGSTEAEREQLAHAISHDLAQPLTTISGFARLMISRYDIELDDQAREQLEAIASRAAEMQGMIDEVVGSLRSSESRHAIAA